jgi:uncharacterized protein YecE (DUF72 family)
MIYIGTSGWSYPRGEGTWNGYFYPAGKVDELEYYSRYFNTVEINNTFYRPPEPYVVKKWVNRVPEGFCFAVKLWQKFTHPAMFEAATGEAAVISPDDVVTFKAGIAPLVSSGKMGPLLAQFPPGFRNDDAGRHILKAVLNTFTGYRIAVELRHRSWSDSPETADLLRGNNAAWVQIDEPKFASSIARELPLTADFAYFRYHGRNAEEWWSGNGETRYRYLYSKEEIVGLAGKVNEAGKKVDHLFAYFNNHWKGYAPKNAGDMIKALQLPFNEPPAVGGLPVEE